MSVSTNSSASDSSSGQGQNWMITIQNPDLSSSTSSGFCQDNPQTWEGSGIIYGVYQIERGHGTPENPEGTLHLQGYLRFSSNKRLSYLKRLHPTAHWEKRRSTHVKAREYCTKEDTRVSEPVEWGTPPGPPSKTKDSENFQVLVKRIRRGWSDDRLVDADPQLWFKHFRAIEKLRSTATKVVRRWETRSAVIWGPTGSGKSYYCNQLDAQYPGKVFWVTKDAGENDWMDGYNGEPVLVYDEFYGWTKLDKLLRVLDWNPLQFRIKGGSVQCLAHTVLFTSNVPPSLWYKPTLLATGSLDRRLNVVARKDRNEPFHFEKLPRDLDGNPLDLQGVDPMEWVLHNRQFLEAAPVGSDTDSDSDDDSDKENRPPSNDQNPPSLAESPSPPRSLLVDSPPRSLLVDSPPRPVVVQRHPPRPVVVQRPPPRPVVVQPHASRSVPSLLPPSPEPEEIPATPPRCSSLLSSSPPIRDAPMTPPLPFPESLPEIPDFLSVPPSTNVPQDSLDLPYFDLDDESHLPFITKPPVIALPPSSVPLPPDNYVIPVRSRVPPPPIIPTLPDAVEEIRSVFFASGPRPSILSKSKKIPKKTLLESFGSKPKSKLLESDGSPSWSLPPLVGPSLTPPISSPSSSPPRKRQRMQRSNAFYHTSPSMELSLESGSDSDDDFQ